MTICSIRPQEQGNLYTVDNFWFLSQRNVLDDLATLRKHIQKTSVLYLSSDLEYSANAVLKKRIRDFKKRNIGFKKSLK